MSKELFDSTKLQIALQNAVSYMHIAGIKAGLKTRIFLSKIWAVIKSIMIFLFFGIVIGLIGHFFKTLICGEAKEEI